MNSLSVTGILIVLIACLISFDPYIRVQEDLVFEDAPVMRISETFDSRFQMVNFQKVSETCFDFGLQKPELLVTMELRDVELENAFSVIAREVGIPILTVGLVEGTVDVSVSDVPLEQVLEMLTLQHGYDFVWLEDQILVGPTGSQLSTCSALSYTTVFKPRFVSAADIGAALPDVYAPYVKTYDEFLMVTAPFSMLKRIQKDIAMLDVPRKQIALDILAFKTPIKIHPELEVRFAGTYLTDYSFETVSKRFGYNVPEGTETHADLVESLVNNSSIPLYAFTRVVVDEGVESHIRLWWRLAGTISAGHEENLSIDERSLATLIFMGDTRSDDSIVLRVSLPSIIEGIQNNWVSDETNSFPLAVKSRDIVVRSGESVVLGGLLKREEVFRTSHVPVLTDLPVVGQLFQWKHRVYTDMEIVIIITPTILGPF